jgi:Integrase core domain
MRCGGRCVAHAADGDAATGQSVMLAPNEEQIAAWLSGEVTSLWTAERSTNCRTAANAGGRTVVKEYVRAHRPRPPATAEARYYVKPGQQPQVDWAEMGLVSIGGAQRKLYAFVAIIAWSRASFVRFTTDMQLLTWLDCHRRAFEFFGGVPLEVLR